MHTATKESLLEVMEVVGVYYKSILYDLLVI